MSLELSSLSDSEPDELDESSTSSFVFDAAFRVCFCLLSGSGEEERLELLSLEEEDEAAMATISVSCSIVGSRAGSAPRIRMHKDELDDL